MTAVGTKPVSSIDEEAAERLKQVPVAVFGKKLRAVDRCEIENYRALYSLMRDYIAMPSAPRPLSVAVFGPPGAGKSFGVKMVAKELEALGGKRPLDPITFYLSQYQKAEDLADVFHLVRDRVLSGKIPLVFFDEFDTSLDDQPLGWLRYFLGPMQDGEFLDRGLPHPIGQAIFVFAGGTCSSYREFAKAFTQSLNKERLREKEQKEKDAFQKAKGPDFLSRLRATLDIPGLDLHTRSDPFGPVEAFPSEPAILLRRANIFYYQLKEKAPHFLDSTEALRVSGSVIQALLHLPKFVHGNRSFEALLDMSHFPGADKFTPALLPASGHTDLHANAGHLQQLLGADYPFPPKEREIIAQTIHEYYVKQRKSPDFSASEFTGKFTIDGLLQVLTADGINIPEANTEIAKLNKLLGESVLNKITSRVSLTKPEHALMQRVSSFDDEERKQINRRILEAVYPDKCPKKKIPKEDDPPLRNWEDLAKDDKGRSYKKSNFEQADHIAVKLFIAGLWFRKKIPGIPVTAKASEYIQTYLGKLARLEHERWVIEKRKTGWIPAADTSRESRNDDYLLHNALFPWEELPDEIKELDLEPVRHIPDFLAAAGYEIIAMEPAKAKGNIKKSLAP